MRLAKQTSMQALVTAEHAASQVFLSLSHVTVHAAYRVRSAAHALCVTVHAARHSATVVVAPPVATLPPVSFLPTLVVPPMIAVLPPTLVEPPMVAVLPPTLAAPPVSAKPPVVTTIDDVPPRAVAPPRCVEPVTLAVPPVSMLESAPPSATGSKVVALEPEHAMVAKAEAKVMRAIPIRPNSYR